MQHFLSPVSNLLTGAAAVSPHTERDLGEAAGKEIQRLQSALMTHPKGLSPSSVSPVLVQAPGSSTEELTIRSRKVIGIILFKNQNSNARVSNQSISFIRTCIAMNMQGCFLLTIYRFQ